MVLATPVSICSYNGVVEKDDLLSLFTTNRKLPVATDIHSEFSDCQWYQWQPMAVNGTNGKITIVAIQETKIDSSTATSELFPETCPYSVYRKDRNIHGGGVMLLVHKDISHMPITELENDSESIWVKVFANKTSHFVASWYRPPGSTSEEFQLFREQLDYIRTHHKGKKLPSAHVLGDFNFKDIDWPDRLSKSGSTLSQSEGQILIDIMNDHGLEQMVHFPT